MDSRTGNLSGQDLSPRRREAGYPLPGHYEEIDDPVAAETVLLDEDTDMKEAVRPMIAADASTEPPDDLPPEPPRVTLADYRALERKVEMIMRLLGINYNNN
jgi:hypothetical protein